MSALAIIGWAFLLGCALAAFLVPIWAAYRFMFGGPKG